MNVNDIKESVENYAQERSKLYMHRAKHTYPSDETELGYYLAGILDGDGSISKEENQPCITFCFHIKDTLLAYKLQEFIKCGSIHSYPSNKNSLVLVITNRNGLIKICHLVHNKLRIQRKVDRLNNLITLLNLSLTPTVIDTTSFLTNHYLAF